MLIALKEKCKENAKHLPSANAPARMALGNETDGGEKGKTKTESVWTPFSYSILHPEACGGHARTRRPRFAKGKPYDFPAAGSPVGEG